MSVCVTPCVFTVVCRDSVITCLIFECYGILGNDHGHADGELSEQSVFQERFIQQTVGQEYTAPQEAADAYTLGVQARRPPELPWALAASPCCSLALTFSAAS